MIITQIEELSNKKCRIYLQDERAFVLYKGEVRKYQLKVGEDLSEEDHQEILEKVLCKRSRKRVLYLLQKMDRTEKQIADKLRQSEYPECIIQDAIAYVKSYGYVNDENYARAYIESRCCTKSVKQIKIDLRKKGISPDVIEHVFEQELYRINEEEQIQKWIEKKKVDIPNASREELYKLYQFLLRKGFSYEKVRKIVTKYSHYV